jgi:hypothetical protein
MLDLGRGALLAIFSGKMVTTICSGTRDMHILYDLTSELCSRRLESLTQQCRLQRYPSSCLAPAETSFDSTRLQMRAPPPIYRSFHSVPFFSKYLRDCTSPANRTMSEFPSSTLNLLGHNCTIHVAHKDCATRESPTSRRILDVTVMDAMLECHLMISARRRSIPGVLFCCLCIHAMTPLVTEEAPFVRGGCCA